MQSPINIVRLSRVLRGAWSECILTPCWQCLLFQRPTVWQRHAQHETDPYLCERIYEYRYRWPPRSRAPGDRLSCFQIASVCRGSTMRSLDDNSRHWTDGRRSNDSRVSSGLLNADSGQLNHAGWQASVRNKRVIQLLDLFVDREICDPLRQYPCRGNEWSQTIDMYR